MCEPIIVKAKNIYIYDNLDNSYIDTRFGAGTFIYGYTKDLNNLFTQQLDSGVLFGYKSQNEIIFKNLLKKELNWFSDFEFCNSGSESIMRAFRIARSVKKKNKIAILSSFWHGGYDGTQISSASNIYKEYSSSGILEDNYNNIILLPVNNINECFQILENNKNDLCMVFCEPVQQLVPHINIELLKLLKKFTMDNNILLGFDEIITGFRLSIGGAQKYLNIYADITCYGKIIGGGFSIGIVGFTEYIKKCIEKATPSIRFGGTFSGNPLSMLGGYQTLLKLIKNKDILYKKINILTEKLCNNINIFCSNNNYLIRFYFVGSFYRIIFTNIPINSMEERKKYELPLEKQNEFYKILKKNGILVAKNPLSFITYCHTDDDIEKIINMYKISIKCFFTE